MFFKVETLFWAFMRGFCGNVNKVSPSGPDIDREGISRPSNNLLLLPTKIYRGGQKHIQRYTGCAQTKDIVQKHTTS